MPEKKRAPPLSTTTPTTTSPEATGTIVIKLISALQPPPGLAEGPAYGTREVRCDEARARRKHQLCHVGTDHHGKETFRYLPANPKSGRKVSRGR